jgi:hypothetical protein
VTNYDIWREDRLRELDAIDAQIDKLPEWIGPSAMKRSSDAIRRWVEGHWQVDDRLGLELQRWSAELDLITVAPTTDDELRAMANEKDGR